MPVITFCDYCGHPITPGIHEEVGFHYQRYRSLQEDPSGSEFRNITFNYHSVCGDHIYATVKNLHKPPILDRV